MFEFIPDELKNKNNWVCWKAIPDASSHSGIKKVPINALTGGSAQSNNPDTWCDFDTAVRTSDNYAGIGFVFDGSGFFGVDLDGEDNAVEDFKNGDSDNIIAEFVHGLQSYSEYSQSGTGIHIICKGVLPEGGRRRGNVEMYEKGRFFVMTGNIAAEYADINDCTELVKPLHEKYLGKQQSTITTMTASGMDVEDIVQKAIESSGGNKFDALYHGDISGYTSNSEADMAFCNMLAFWCRRDIDLMDRIYRTSGLMREKWDRRQSNSTYGKLTLTKAADECTNVYEPRRKADDYSISITGTASNKINKIYTLDDTGNAERVFDMYGDRLKYSYIDKKWLFYKNGKWNTDNIGEIYRVIDMTLDVMKSEAKYWEKEGLEKEFAKHQKHTRSNKAKNAMVKEFEHLVPILPQSLDRHSNIINCQNGLYDLKKGVFMGHDKDLFITKITNVPYSDSFKEPTLWIKFLNDIFGEDQQLIRYIQKACGYCLSGSTQEQCAFFLIGSGRNGKSTFLEIIRYILGDYATNIQPETIMVKPSSTSGANSDIARLKGARLVTTVEPNEGARLNEGLLKQLTGDDIVTARKLYSEEFEFKPEFKLWMATNHKPVIRGTDTGIWRRIHLVPFTVQIPDSKVDKMLKYKLRKELPDIFRWMLDGYKLWSTEGLSLPPVMAEAVKDYRHEMDVISSFIDACCAEGPEREVKAADLFNAYIRWASEHNEYRMSSTKFGAEVAKRFEKCRKNNGIFYKGIDLLDSSNGYSISIG